MHQETGLRDKASFSAKKTSVQTTGNGLAGMLVSTGTAATAETAITELAETSGAQEAQTTGMGGKGKSLVRESSIPDRKTGTMTEMDAREELSPTGQENTGTGNPETARGRKNPEKDGSATGAKQEDIDNI